MFTCALLALGLGLGCSSDAEPISEGMAGASATGDGGGSSNGGQGSEDGSGGMTSGTGGASAAGGSGAGGMNSAGGSKGGSSLSRAELQQMLDDGSSVKDLLEQGAAAEELYGLTYQGGFIFQVDSGGSGLVVSKNDIGKWPKIRKGRDQWTPPPHEATGATKSAAGTGADNTAKIVAAAGGGADYAAKSCDEHVEDGYDDWFLPAIDSFELMKERLFDDGYGNFPGTYSFSYWSSTEIDGQKAYSAHFEADDPAASETFKTSVLSTRPVRKFDQ